MPTVHERVFNTCEVCRGLRLQASSDKRFDSQFSRGLEEQVILSTAATVDLEVQKVTGAVPTIPPARLPAATPGPKTQSPPGPMLEPYISAAHARSLIG